jgi:hypothetical protein
MSEVLTGGCQCGAVRYRVTGPFKAAICHCRMCQKAFGSYFGPLVTVAEVAWTRGAPSYFRSSNKGQRGFCQMCGTPLALVDDDGWIEISGGSLDDPEAVAPAVQFNLKDKLAFFDTLAAVRHQPNGAAEAAANATVVSNQHPDHDTDHWSPHPGGQA